MAKRGILIEFFGVPGTGKTHLMHQLLRHLQEDYSVDALAARNTRPPPRYSWRWIKNVSLWRWWIIRHPRHSYRLHRAIKDSGQRSSKDTRRYFRSWIKTIERQNRRLRKHEIVVQDHGCLQLLWGIGYQADKHQWQRVLHRIIEQVNWPDLLVIVNAHDATITQRLEERSNEQGITSRVQDQDLTNKSAWKKIVELSSAIECEAKTMAKEHGFLILEIDNSREDSGTTAIRNLAARLSTKSRLPFLDRECEPENQT